MSFSLIDFDAWKASIAMAKLSEDPTHFMPLYGILLLPSSASIRDAFSALSKRAGNGGGLVVKAAIGDLFVKSISMAQAVTNLASRPPVGADKAGTGVGNLLAGDWDKILNEPIANILTDVEKVSDRLGKPGVLRLETRNAIADPAELLQDANHRAIAVLDEGQMVGLFLNHEAIVRILNSDPPMWYCEAGHANADPDHGYCSYCPRKLKDVK